jgi:hypothetical protein
MSVPARLGVFGAAAVAVAIILVGLRFALDPYTGATSAGVGFSAVSLGETKGVRDIASGLVVLVLLRHGHRGALAGVLLALAFIPACDAVIVLLNGGSPVLAFGWHVTTAVLLVAFAALLRRQPAPPRAARVNAYQESTR